MPIWHPHTLVTFGGKLNTAVADQEIWQCGVRVMKAGAAAPLDDHDAYLAHINVNLASWFTSADNWTFPTQATLAWIKANPIGADGLYSDTTTHLFDYAPPVAGHGTGATPWPDIMCIAISWKTAKAVRKHSYATHGRIYPPNYGSMGANDGGMRKAVGVANAWLSAGSALLGVLNGGANPCVPIVASGHNGEYQPITGVRVGDVLDVQRRRKDALKENYSEAVYSSG